MQSSFLHWPPCTWALYGSKGGIATRGKRVTIKACWHGASHASAMTGGFRSSNQVVVARLAAFTVSVQALEPARKAVRLRRFRAAFFCHRQRREASPLGRQPAIPPAPVCAEGELPRRGKRSRPGPLGHPPLGKGGYLYNSAVTNTLPLRELPPISATRPLPVPRRVSTSPSLTGASGFKHSL